MWPSRMPMPRSDMVSVTIAGATLGRLKQNVGTRSARRGGVVNAVDDGAGSLQDFEHLERKCSFVLAD